MLSTGYNYVGLRRRRVADDRQALLGRGLHEGPGPDRRVGQARDGLEDTGRQSTTIKVTSRWGGGDTRLQVLTSGLRYFQIQRRRDGGELVHLPAHDVEHVMAAPGSVAASTSSASGPATRPATGAPGTRRRSRRPDARSRSRARRSVSRSPAPGRPRASAGLDRRPPVERGRPPRGHGAVSSAARRIRSASRNAAWATARPRRRRRSRARSSGSKPGSHHTSMMASVAVRRSIRGSIRPTSRSPHSSGRT